MFDGSELNPEQLAAATHPGGPLLVLAGAGTGKTTTLCARVEWLLRDGRRARARAAADVHAARGARDARPRAAARTPARAAGRRRARSTRSRTGSCARTPRRSGSPPASRCSTPATRPTCSTCCARSTGTPRARDALPAQAHARRHLLADGQRPAPAARRSSTSASRGSPSTSTRSSALFRAYGARKQALGVLDLDDLLLHWRALCCDDVIGPRDRRRVRPRARRRVPGRQRAAGRHRPRRCVRGGATSPRSATTSRRSTAFRSAQRAAHPRLPGATSPARRS